MQHQHGACPRGAPESSPVPVIGVIEPARAAVAVAGNRPIGVIGTAGTIASGAYERAIHRLAPDIRVLTAACPLFVPLVEEGWFDHPATRIVAEEYLAPPAPGASEPWCSVAPTIRCSHHCSGTSWGPRSP